MTTDVASPARTTPPAVPVRPWRQLVRFAGVGAASTAAYALLYLVLRPLTGPFTANALALLLTAVANTAANRRLTFGVRGSSGMIGDHAVGLLAFGAGLALTPGQRSGPEHRTDRADGGQRAGHAAAVRRPQIPDAFGLGLIAARRPGENR
jgi:hypothetical protein